MKAKNKTKKKNKKDSVMEFSISNEILKEYLACCTPVANEGIVTISESGWRTVASDPADVSMVDIQVSRDVFSEFKVSKEEKICIDFKKLLSIINIASSTEYGICILSIKNNVMTVKIGGFSYKFPLIDLSSVRELGPPTLAAPVRVVLGASDFRRMCKAAEKVSKYVVLGVSNDIFYVLAEEDGNEMRWNVEKTDLVAMEGDEAKSIFSLEYLSSLNKAYKTQDIELEIGIDYPLKIKFDIADGFGECVFYLAPRIEES